MRWKSSRNLSSTKPNFGSKELRSRNCRTSWSRRGKGLHNWSVCCGRSRIHYGAFDGAIGFIVLAFGEAKDGWILFFLRFCFCFCDLVSCDSSFSFLSFLSFSCLLYGGGFNTTRVGPVGCPLYDFIGLIGLFHPAFRVPHEYCVNYILGFNVASRFGDRGAYSDWRARI